MVVTHPKNHVKLNFNPWQDSGEGIFYAWMNFIHSGSGRIIPNFSFKYFFTTTRLSLAARSWKLFILFTIAWIMHWWRCKYFTTLLLYEIVWLTHCFPFFIYLQWVTPKLNHKTSKTCALYNDTWKLAVEKLGKIFHQHRAVNVKVIAWNFALTQSVAVSSNQSQRHPNSASIIIWMYKFSSLSTFSSHHHHPRNHQQ